MGRLMEKTGKQHLGNQTLLGSRKGPASLSNYPFLAPVWQCEEGCKNALEGLEMPASEGLAL